MSTERQIHANQQNAKKSTGPKTDEGKARAAQNARIHGFAAQTLVFLSKEEHDAFLDRCQELSDQYPFEHALKQSLVAAIATAEAQLRLIGLTKRGLFRNILTRIEQPGPDRPEPNTKAHVELAADYLGAAFLRNDRSAECLLLLNRYEVEQRRLFYQAIHELEALAKPHKTQAPAPKPAVRFTRRPGTETNPISSPAKPAPKVPNAA